MQFFYLHERKDWKRFLKLAASTKKQKQQIRYNGQEQKKRNKKEREIDVNNIDTIQPPYDIEKKNSNINKALRD